MPTNRRYDALLHQIHGVRRGGPVGHPAVSSGEFPVPVEVETQPIVADGVKVPAPR